MEDTTTTKASLIPYSIARAPKVSWNNVLHVPCLHSYFPFLMYHKFALCLIIPGSCLLQGHNDFLLVGSQWVLLDYAAKFLCSICVTDSPIFKEHSLHMSSLRTHPSDFLFWLYFLNHLLYFDIFRIFFF